MMRKKRGKSTKKTVNLRKKPSRIIKTKDDIASSISKLDGEIIKIRKKIKGIDFSKREVDLPFEEKIPEDKEEAPEEELPEEKEEIPEEKIPEEKVPEPNYKEVTSNIRPNITKEVRTNNVVVKKEEIIDKTSPKIQKAVSFANLQIERIKEEVKKVVIGQDRVVKDLLVCLFCEGCVLLEGVPGIAKTLIMKALSSSVGCTSKRIQFTADLLPTDITGFTAYSREKGFFIVKGPIFANFVLADEINRAPPKVQSALIEAMQEKQVTIGKETFPLERPFLVFATENPLETRGVYTLPEAQIDRFFFKIMVKYPSPKEEELIIDTNVTNKRFEDYGIKAVISPDEVIRIQNLVKEIFVNDKIKKYITEIVRYTRPSKNNGLEVIKKYAAWGASPRASINLYLASKANALLNNRSFVIPQDVKDVAYNVLRHRILLNYQGQIDNIRTEDIISEILKKVKVP